MLPQCIALFNRQRFSNYVPVMFITSFALYEATRVHLQVQRRLVEFMLAAFHRSPHSIAILKKPVANRLGEAYDNPAKTELALQLCCAIEEHGGGGGAHKDAARELFEGLELLLYENLSSSRLGLGDTSHSSRSSGLKKSSESRLLCFEVTAIVKLVAYHRQLLPCVIGKCQNGCTSHIHEDLQNIQRQLISGFRLSCELCGFIAHEFLMQGCGNACKIV